MKHGIALGWARHLARVFAGETNIRTLTRVCISMGPQMMRLIICVIAVLGLAGPCNAELAAASSTDEVLDRLYEVGKDLKTFSPGLSICRLISNLRT